MTIIISKSNTMQIEMRNQSGIRKSMEVAIVGIASLGRKGQKLNFCWVNNEYEVRE